METDDTLEVTVDTELGPLRMVFSQPNYCYAEINDPIINRVQYGKCYGRFSKTSTLNKYQEGWRIDPDGRLYGMRKNLKLGNYNQSQLQAAAYRKLRDLMINEITKAYTPEMDRAAWATQKDYILARIDGRLAEMEEARSNLLDIKAVEERRQYPQPSPEYKI